MSSIYSLDSLKICYCKKCIHNFWERKNNNTNNST